MMNTNMVWYWHSFFEYFQKILNYLKDVLKKKNFCTNLADKCIEMFFNKQVPSKILESTDSKKEIFIVLHTMLVCLLFKNMLTKMH